MRVLLVAPHEAGLPGTREELQDIINSGLEIRLLSGIVTPEELVRECTADQFDVLWFTGHSDAKGLQLSNSLLPHAQLVSIVRSCEAWLVVLNSCESVAIAQQIAEQTGAGVVATISDVPDAVAYATGALFASWLASTEDPLWSYQMAKPGNNSTYIYIPSLALMSHRRPTPQQHELETRIRDLERQVFELQLMLKQVDIKDSRSLTRLEVFLLALVAAGTFAAVWLMANGGVG